MTNLNFLSKSRWLLVPLMLLTLSVGQMWGAEQTITLNFYDEANLSSTSGTAVTVGFARDKTTCSDESLTDMTKVITAASLSGTVRYGMNGGVSFGANNSNAASWTITFDSGFEFYKVEIVGAHYETNNFTINGDAAKSGSLNAKGTKLKDCTNTLLWEPAEGDEYSGALTFAKTATKRGTIYTITLYYDDGEDDTPSYTVTATRNDNAYGTVSVSGTTITATPADCYQVASGASGYTITSGTATVSHTSNSNTLTVTPSSDCTVQVNFEKKTVNTYIDEIQGNEDIEDCETHDAPSLDDKAVATSGTCAQQHYHFVGWVTAENKANPTDANVITAGTEMTANGTTYYAVWAKGSSGGGFDNTTGGTFKIYADVSGTKHYAVGTGSKISSTTNAAEATEYTFEKQSAGVYYIKTGSNYIKYASSTNLGTQTDGYSWTITAATHGSWRVTSGTSGRAWIYRAGSTNQFGGYSTSNVNGTEYFDLEIGGGYEYSDYKTVCCTELGQINGSFSFANVSETGATAQWSWSGETTGILKNVLKVYDNSNDNLVATFDNISGSATSKEMTGLTPCKTYYVKLTTVSSGGTYCDGVADQAGAEKVTFTTNGWNVNYISENDEEALLSNVTKLTGATSACTNANYVATFEAAAGYKLPDDIVVYIAGSESTVGDDYTWSISNGTGTLTVFTSELSEEIGVRIIGEALGCTANPTIGAASLSGTYSNSAVGVTVSSCGTGSADCAWTDYGFVWGTSANPTVTNDTHTTQVGTEGNVVTWSGSLAGSFSTGVEYHFRAYGKNSKDGAAYAYGTDNTFTLRSVTFKDGATTLSTVYLNNGGKVAAPAENPSKTGYNFTGWKLNSAVYDFNATVSSDLELQASWEKQNYSITKTFTGCTSSSMPASYEYTGTASDFSYTITADAKYVLPAAISVTMDGDALTLNTDYTWNSTSGALAISKIITGNLEITVEAQRLYTVTLMDLDEDNTLDQETVGGNVVLPNRASCTGYTFAGWTASWVAEQASWTSTAPASILPAGNYAPTADLNLYPVYTKVEEEGEENTFNLVTDADNLADGDQILIVSPAGSITYSKVEYPYAAQAMTSTASGVRLGCEEVTISSNSITSATAEVWTLSGSAGSWKIHSGNKYLYADAKNKLSTESEANGLTFAISIGADDKATISTTAGSDAVYAQMNASYSAGDVSTYFALYTGNQKPVYIYKSAVSSVTYYISVSGCASAPTATPSVDNLNDVVAAGASGTITMTYTNVNTANVAVSLWNNEACTEAFSGVWLTASLNGDKNIAYSIAANTSYYDARSAYIKLTAPAETSGPADAVVVIPVSQVKKATVFSNLADLAAAELTSGTEVTVTIDNRITGIYTNYYDYRYGIYLNEQKYNQEATPVLKDIEIYFKGEQVPASEPEWVIGGTVSGTITGSWEYFSSDELWELKPGEGWHWTNLTYNAPATVSSVTISGTTPDKTTYSVGEAFDPAGLTVHVEYSDESDADITASDDDWAYVTWNVDPATFAAEHIGTGKSVSATATYSGVSSTATEISGLTVNKVAVTGVTLNQNAATLKVGKKVTLTATVAPANATYKGIEWSTSDGSIATVEDGEVTAVAAGSATITATATDDNTKKATCTITVTEGINFAAGDWTLVKDAAELTVGSYVIIAAADYDQALKSYESGNNCGAEDATKSGDMIEYDEDFGIFEIKAGNKVNTIALFDDANENYLYAASNSSNHLKAETTLTDNSSWSVSVTSVGVASLTAQGTNSHNQMKYNHSNNPPIFSCYSSGQDAVALYKYYAPVPKVTYNKNTTDDVENLPAIQKTEWETDAYKATIAAGPSRTGYTFTGWNSDAEGEGDAYAAGTKYSFAADIILYAQWNALPKFHVTYNTSGSQGATPTDATDYYEGDEVTLASASGLSNAGYFFDKWVATYVDGNSDTQTLEIEDGKFTMPAFNVTVTATWARKSSDKWIKVTEVSQLVADKEYIIVNTDATYAVGAQGSNNRTAAAIEENNGILTISDAVAKFILGIPEENKYTFYQNGTVDNVDKGYLYAASSGSNYMRTQVENNANGVWTISIGEEGAATVTATGTNTRNIMRYNPNSGSPMFSCYASNSSVQNPVVLYYKAPKIEINDNESVNVSDAAGSDIVIHDGGTLNVDADKQIGDLTVEAGGKVVLDENKLTVVGTFTIETTMASGASGQLTGATASNFAANGPAYIDITLGDNGNPDHWHAFTVPFPVDAISGVYDLDNNKLNNEEHYAIMEYLGDVRAQGKYGWKKIRTTLVPGTFYLMTVDGLRTTYRFKKTADGALVAGNTKDLEEYPLNGGTEEHNDNGWNGVGNPTLRYGQVAYKVQVLNPTSYTYEPFEANETNFVVGTPFFIQANAAAAAADMTFGAASGEANYAPARTPAKGIKSVKVTFGNEEYKDRLYISASEDALNRYETGKDLAKMTMTSTPKVAQIFGKAYNAKLCMVYAPMSNDQAVYDLSLYAPANGEYTIAAPEVENADLYLTKDGAIIWDLTMGAYPVDLNKGTTEGYGLLLKAKAPQTPTGVEQSEVSHQPSDIQKIIINDNVFILRGGQLYGIDGKLIK